MTVIEIYEEIGLIGIAKDYKSAIEFLVNNRWIKSSTEVKVYDDDIYYQRIDENLGDDWFDKMCSWDSIEYFNVYWYGSYGSFELVETEVYGG